MPNRKEDKKPPQKKFYTVEVECLIPAIAKYKVFIDEGEYEKAAIETVRISPIERPALKLGMMKRIRARIYDYGTNTLRHIKQF
jgi:hypothetical protein